MIKVFLKNKIAFISIATLVSFLIITGESIAATTPTPIKTPPVIDINKSTNDALRGLDPAAATRDALNGNRQSSTTQKPSEQGTSKMSFLEVFKFVINLIGKIFLATIKSLVVTIKGLL